MQRTFYWEAFFGSGIGKGIPPPPGGEMPAPDCKPGAVQRRVGCADTGTGQDGPDSWSEETVDVFTCGGLAGKKNRKML